MTYVAEQDFKKDVTDRATAKAEARPYIDVLDFFDITNPVAPQFNPKDTTTRGQFASFLYKTSQVTESVEVKVASVKAINNKTLELVGTGLGALKAEDITVEGNKVVSISTSADKKTATVVLENALSPEVSTLVTINKEEFKVVYSLQAAKVAVTEASYDDDTKNQYVAFTVNGSTGSIEDLFANGYEVKFDATNKKRETVDLFEDATTGKLKEDLTDLTGDNPSKGKEYQVQMTLTKAGEVIISELQTITIKNIDLTASSIQDFTLENSKGFEQNSTTLVAGETAEFTEIKVKTDSSNDDVKLDTQLSLPTKVSFQ